MLLGVILKVSIFFSTSFFRVFSNLNSTVYLNCISQRPNVFQASSCFRGNPTGISGNPWGRSCCSWETINVFGIVLYDLICIFLCRHCLSPPRVRGLQEWRQARSLRVGRPGKGRWLKESREPREAGRLDEMGQGGPPSSLHLCTLASILHLPIHSLRACLVLTRGIIRKMSGRISR